MTFFIRTKDNNVIADVEIFVDKSTSNVDVGIAINIKNYSTLLIEADGVQRQEIIQQFHALSELRGWLFEVFLPAYKEWSLQETKNAVAANVRKGMKEICDKLDLWFVEE